MPSDYSRIEKAIEFIHDHKLKQPLLSEVAAHVHLSEHHFQRMFSRWAGISPKRYLQFLTLEHAKVQLEANVSVVESAFAAGLSGSSRLHDLFISMEGVTPGDFKTDGEGLLIRYGFHETHFGFAFVATTERGVCKVDFINNNDNECSAVVSQLQKLWKNAELIHDQSATLGVADALFSAQQDALTLIVKGTNFQIQVWKALLNIPPGAVTTYQAIANVIGKPKAVRAVASAIGANPVAHLIPCHRVIRGSGELGGYRWGLPRKAAMLACESS